MCVSAVLHALQLAATLMKFDDFLGVLDFTLRKPMLGTLKFFLDHAVAVAAQGLRQVRSGDLSGQLSFSFLQLRPRKTVVLRGINKPFQIIKAAAFSSRA